MDLDIAAMTRHVAELERDVEDMSIAFRTAASGAAHAAPELPAVAAALDRFGRIWGLYVTLVATSLELGLAVDPGPAQQLLVDHLQRIARAT